ncbi:MAG: hypothetical protein GY696_25620, partial [Gammaproteobacteria bacterium]|nr:hypothetical protein [Gammaproteobacteria bacterium]
YNPAHYLAAAKWNFGCAPTQSVYSYAIFEMARMLGRIAESAALIILKVPGHAIMTVDQLAMILLASKERDYVNDTTAFVNMMVAVVQYVLCQGKYDDGSLKYIAQANNRTFEREVSRPVADNTLLVCLGSDDFWGAAYKWKDVAVEAPFDAETTMQMACAWAMATRMTHGRKGHQLEKSNHRIYPSGWCAYSLALRKFHHEYSDEFHQMSEYARTRFQVDWSREYQGEYRRRDIKHILEQDNPQNSTARYDPAANFFVTRGGLPSQCSPVLADPFSRFPMVRGRQYRTVELDEQGLPRTLGTGRVSPGVARASKRSGSISSYASEACQRTSARQEGPSSTRAESGSDKRPRLQTRVVGGEDSDSMTSQRTNATEVLAPTPIVLDEGMFERLKDQITTSLQEDWTAKLRQMVSGAIDPVRGELPIEAPPLQPSYYTAQPYAMAPYPPSPFRAMEQVGRPVPGIPYQPSYMVVRHPYPIPVPEVYAGQPHQVYQPGADPASVPSPSRGPGSTYISRKKSSPPPPPPPMPLKPPTPRPF